jgi:hypothetical protein
MLRKIARSALVLLMLCIASVTSVYADPSAAFDPLAMFRINVLPPDQQDLAQIVDSFAQAHHFQIGDDVPLAVLPGLGRRPAEREIYIVGSPSNPDTFFRLSNFRKEDVFELIAYSHQSKDVWLAPWNELISIITAKFGEANVRSVDLSPRQNRPDKPNHQNQVRQAFAAPAPAAFMKIHMQKGTSDDVLGVIQSFASLHHFDTEKFDFPIDGRTATFRKIVIDAGSFFVVDASSDDPEVDVYGFSQEPENIWGPRWREFTSKMEGEFTGRPRW